MANWVCKQDGVLFTPGAPCCPECQTRDAYEQGGDKALNVYDAVDVTGIASPGAAWGVVNEAVAEALHVIRQDGGVPMTGEDARAQLMGGGKDSEVSERLGLVPGDPGAADSATDPEPVTGSNGEVREESGMSAGREQGGDTGDKASGGEDDEPLSEDAITEADDDGGVELPADGVVRQVVLSGDTPGTGKAKSTTKARQKDVPS